MKKIAIITITTLLSILSIGCSSNNEDKKASCEKTKKEVLSSLSEATESLNRFESLMNNISWLNNLEEIKDNIKLQRSEIAKTNAEVSKKTRSSELEKCISLNTDTAFNIRAITNYTNEMTFNIDEINRDKDKLLANYSCKNKESCNVILNNELYKRMSIVQAKTKALINRE